MNHAIPDMHAQPKTPAWFSADDADPVAIISTPGQEAIDSHRRPEIDPSLEPVLTRIGPTNVRQTSAVSELRANCSGGAHRTHLG